MFLIPYYLEQISHPKAEFSMTIAWVFLTEGGTHLWCSDDQEEVNQEFLEQEYFQANGFVGHTTLFDTERGLCCFQVDPAKTKFADFYMWTDFLQKQEDIPQDCDIWRPFFWIGSRELGSKDEWDWLSETEEQPLGSFGTAKDLWQVLRIATTSI